MEVKKTIRKFSRAKVPVEETEQTTVNEVDVPQIIEQEIVKPKRVKKTQLPSPIAPPATEEPPQEEFLEELKNKPEQEEIAVPLPEVVIPTEPPKKKNIFDNNFLDDVKQTRRDRIIKQPTYNDMDSILFADSSKSETPILGIERRKLLTKLNQMKHLFPEHLKDFKIKKNANEKELLEYIDEADAIIELSSVEKFTKDAVLQGIQTVEPLTYDSDFNIKGLALELSKNPQFTSLCKRLWLKYSSWCSCPIEYQMLILVSVTTHSIIMKNRQRSSINSYLDQPL